MNSFGETFAIKHNDTNSNKEHLLPLTKKIKVFLLQTFKNTYTKLGESKNIQTVKGKGRFHLAGLNIIVDKKQMPLGFSSKHIPITNECDHCGKYT